MNLIKNLTELKQQDSDLIQSISDFDLLIDSLNELDQMVEMKELKSAIVSQIKFLIVNSESSQYLDGHMLHTVIYSKPGCGKTTVSMILAKIWTAVGLFQKSKTSKKKSHTPIKSIHQANDALPIISKEKSSEIKDLELHIQRLINNGKLKNGVVERLQNYITQIKSNMSGYKSSLDTINYNLRTIIRELSKDNSNDYSFRACKYLIENCIELNDKILYNIDVETKTFIPDEKIRFIVPILPPKPIKIGSVPSVSHVPYKPSLDKIPKKMKRIKNPSKKSKKRLPTPRFQRIMLEPDLEPKVFGLIRIVGREDFVGGYQGQTAIKTEKLLRDSIGKVLFIDEAYALVNDEKDTFGREALTVLNRFMSEHSHEIVVIFAGYKDLMEKTIFLFQPGLKRRCSWYFEIKGYEETGLSKIFVKQLKENGWSVAKGTDLVKFFKEHLKEFPAYGGDTLRLAFYSKVCYSEDVFDHKFNNNKVIDNDILMRALKHLKEYRIKDDNTELSHPQMYC